MDRLSRALLTWLLAAVAAGPALATSYVMIRDEDLADEAATIVEGRVVAAEPAPVLGRPATDSPF